MPQTRRAKGVGRGEYGLGSREDTLAAAPLRHAERTRAESVLFPRRALALAVLRERVSRQNAEREVRLQRRARGPRRSTARADETTTVVRRPEVVSDAISAICVLAPARIARILRRAKRKRDVEPTSAAAHPRSARCGAAGRRSGGHRPKRRRLRDGTRVTSTGTRQLRVEADERLHEQQVEADRVLIVREQRVERRRIGFVGQSQHVRGCAGVATYVMPTGHAGTSNAERKRNDEDLTRPSSA